MRPDTALASLNNQYPAAATAERTRDDRRIQFIRDRIETVQEQISPFSVSHPRVRRIFLSPFFTIDSSILTKSNVRFRAVTDSPR